MPTALLIGSCEPFSGKSAVVLGLGRQLLRLGVGLSFGKPLASDADDDQLVQQPGDPLLDPDVRFVGSTLGLPESQLIPSLHTINADTAHGRLLAGDLAPGAGFEALKQRLRQGADDLALLEAAGSLSEGHLYGLSLLQLARGPAPSLRMGWRGWCSTSSNPTRCPSCARRWCPPSSVLASMCLA
jgi:hypothetical protein